jgi:hypothetical protein
MTGGTTTGGSSGTINSNQYTWNQNNNTSTSQLLNDNTNKASQVNEGDKLHKVGASAIAGAGVASSYHGMALLLGDGDPVKGHQIIQTNPEYKKIADTVNGALGTVAEATAPVFDAIGGIPARVEGGIKASLGGEITQDDIDNMNPISTGIDKGISWIAEKIDENVDNPELADYYKHLAAIAGQTFVIAEGVDAVKGGVSKVTNNKQTLYRAVTSEELAQIKQTGTFQNPYGNEVKYFSVTKEGALQFSNMAKKNLGYGETSIIKTSYPKSMIDSLNDLRQYGVDRGIKSITVPTENLQYLTKPKIIK